MAENDLLLLVGTAKGLFILDHERGNGKWSIDGPHFAGRAVYSAFYDDRKGRPKAVRYWLMTATDEAEEFEPNDEVDELRWLPASEATELLTYEHDIDLAQEVSDL